MPTALQGLAPQAKRAQGHRCRHLVGMLHAPCLGRGWQHLRQEAARGGDRGTAAAEGRHIIQHVSARMERVTRGAYRAKVV